MEHGISPPRASLVCLAALLVASCGGGSGDSSIFNPPEGEGSNGGSSGGGDSIFDVPFNEEEGGVCGLNAQREWVDANMRDYYLFYDQVPVLPLEDHASAEELIQALRVPPDRFSYVGDAALNEAFFEEGESFGYGWRLRRRANGDLAVALVEPQSPLAVAGVVRGEVMLSVDGVLFDDITSSEQVNDLLGTGDDTRTITLGVQGIDGNVREVDVTRGLYSVQAVLDSQVIEVGTTRVGYLSFLTFIETARDELQTVFAEFATQDIDELVIDLRFNGGGRIDVSNVLASRVIGDAGRDRDFLRYQLNDRYQDLYDPDDLRLPFEQLSDSLDLPRVYVLQLDGTCSASELVINGLAPHIDVVTVGQTTCGKPFGTRGVTLNDECNKVMHAVEVEFVNDSGVGGYADGLAATCAASDDYLSTLGAPDEGMLSVALQHIQTGSCTIGIASTPEARRAHQRNSAINPTNPYDPGVPLR